jgi:hypothetical protein
MRVDRCSVAAVLALWAGGIATSGHAQVQQPGFFGSLSGWYQFSGNNDDFLAAPSGFITGKPGPGDGIGGGARAGYRFSDWDLALLGRYTWYDKSHGSIPPALITVWERARGGVGDLEIGYTMAALDGAAVRLAAGPRLVWWHHHGEASNGGAGTTRYFGGGGAVKANVAWTLAPSFSLFAGAEASLTYGKSKGNFGTGGIDRQTTATSIGGEVGVAWEVAPLVNVGIGYMLDAWWSAGRRFDILGGRYSEGINRFNHGPFVRLAYNWGPPAVVSPLLAPADSGGAYVVFFDFDRATLTSQAIATIRQAAAAATSGNKTRIGVTGHADRAGSAGYNMALSLRRANAVKDQLVREGIPANQIAVVGRGEGQPLVTTADGVREPQNRRVEIVLN